METDYSSKYREFYNLCLNKKNNDALDFIKNFGINNKNEGRIYSKLYGNCINAQNIDLLDFFKDKEISFKDYEKAIKNSIKNNNFDLLSKILDEKRYQINKNKYIHKLILSDNFDIYKLHNKMSGNFENLNFLIDSLIKINSVDIYNDLKENFFKNKINNEFDYFRLLIIKDDLIGFKDVLNNIKSSKNIEFLYRLIVISDRPILAKEFKKFTNINGYNLKLCLDSLNLLFFFNFEKNKSIDILLDVVDYSEYLDKYSKNLNTVLNKKQEEFLNLKIKEKIESEINFEIIKTKNKRKI